MDEDPHWIIGRRWGNRRRPCWELDGRKEGKAIRILVVIAGQSPKAGGREAEE